MLSMARSPETVKVKWGGLALLQDNPYNCFKLKEKSHMNRMQRRKFEMMPLSELRRLRDDLQKLVSELENSPRREIDIATAQTGDPALTAQVLRIIGDKNSNKWGQVERILCSSERCPNCPHGDFRYEYWKNKKSGVIKVIYKGKAFPQEALDKLGFFEFTEDGKSLRIPAPGTE